MVNMVVLQGRLCADPENRSTANGTSVSRLRVANDTGFGDKKRTDFFTVTAWGKTAEFVAKWFSKGDPILITGEIHQNTYKDKNGVQQNTYDITAREVNFCGKAEKPETEPEDPEEDYPF